MTDSMHSMILRRMTGRQAGDAAEVPLTSSRIVRLALTKAANDTIGLVLTVTDMGEDTKPLDDLLEDLNESLMLIGLQRAGELVGLAAVDVQLRAAIMEMQTTGRVTATMAEDRPATGTDKMMCERILSTFLASLSATTGGTEFDGWIDGAALGDLIASRRAAGLLLTDQTYRTLRLDADLGVADRKGYILVALPVIEPQIHADPAPETPIDWADQFQAALAAAPGELDALLHRFKLPLAQAQDLHVGQVLPLLGCTVNSIRLMASDGKTIAQAKLGQVGGMRAIRVEAEPVPQMQDLGGASAMGISGMVGHDDPASYAQDGLMDQGGNDLAQPISDTMDIETADISAPDLPMAEMDLDAMSLPD